MTPRLIEHWLPVDALGIESVRERTPMTPFPAPNRLHVWWARRPLVAARAAVLAALLPHDADRERFLKVLGIQGDPVAARRRIEQATRDGVRLGAEAYGYPRAFGHLPDTDDFEWMRYEIGRVGLEQPRVLDPTAGGGSIPFETARMRLPTVTNDLNPVAVLIEKATLEWPLRFGLEVKRTFEPLGQRFTREVRQRLEGIFPSEGSDDLRPDGYLYARTITCPYCDGLIPLSPNWRLAPDGTGVKLQPDRHANRCTFEIVASVRDQSPGTVKGGAAQCPYPGCERTIDGDEVKRQAQAGQMGEQLYTVVYKRRILTKTKTGKPREKWERGYRAPRPEDDVSALVRERLAEKLPEWEALNIVPTEAVPDDINDDRPIQYGMPRWRDLFSPRQLLCHGVSVEVFRELLESEQTKGELSELTKAAFGYLALSMDKLLTYNCRSSRWHPGREVMAQIFERHDFSVKFTFAEMAPLIVGLGYDWAIEQTAKCIKELVELTRPGASDTLDLQPFTPPPLTLTCQSADQLQHLDDASIDAVVMDPPYYDNVMYAELSDFFYVWLKRTAGYVYPELFTRALTDKDREAVANPAKFKNQERGAKALATRDYQERMAAIFAECRRVLKPDGIMTLMFTHKATGAWDALAKGLFDAGFTITASWPINTEAEGSLHIKDKAAANSTIFLICRPRPVKDTTDILYWEDVEPRVSQAVRTRVGEFQQAGIRGVDLYLACFGPALEEFSRHWPLQRGRPRPPPPERQRRRQQDIFEEPWDPYAATPEDALTTARREVKRWRLEQLTRIRRQAELDPLTEWFVLAWDAFAAPQFPYDEALQLARVVGVDMERDLIGNLAEKKASDVLLWDSHTRAANGKLGPADGSRTLLDALHHAAQRGQQATLQAAVEQLKHNRLDQQPAFLMALEAVLEVLPPSRQFTGFDPGKALAPAASDFEALENLRRLAFGEQVPPPRQLDLLDVPPR